MPKLTSANFALVWSARRHDAFLKRFLWLRGHFEPEHGEYYEYALEQRLM